MLRETKRTGDRTTRRKRERFVLKRMHQREQKTRLTHGLKKKIMKDRMHRQQRQWCEEQEKTDTEHKLELREGWAVTKADPEGSEEALKADSQSRDEGGSVWKQRRWNTIWGQGPPAASPLCSGPVSASASEVLNNPPAHTHTHTHTHPAAPGAAPSCHLVTQHSPAQTDTAN